MEHVQNTGYFASFVLQFATSPIIEAENILNAFRKLQDRASCDRGTARLSTTKES